MLLAGGGAPAGACGPPDALIGKVTTGPRGAGESSTPTQASHGDNRAGAWVTASGLGPLQRDTLASGERCNSIETLRGA
jgi:hypothetical protein